MISSMNDFKALMSFPTCTYADVVYLFSSLNVKEINGPLNNILLQYWDRRFIQSTAKYE